MSYILHIIILSSTDKLSQSVARTSGIGRQAMKAGLGPEIIHWGPMHEWQKWCSPLLWLHLYLYLHSHIVMRDSNIRAARLTYTEGLIVNCVAYWEKESDFWGDTKPRLNGSPSLKVRQSSPEPLSNALVVWYFCTMFTYSFAFMQCHRPRRAIFLLLLSKPSLARMPPDPYQEG